MDIVLKTVVLIFLVITSVSCKKLVDIDPPVTNPISSTVYTSNATAAAALTGIYSKMSEGESGFTGINSLTMKGGLLADEFKNYADNNAGLSLAYKNALNSSDVPFWAQFYQYIYYANTAIDGLEKSTGVTLTIKQQLTGEAKFIRAFCHFYLVNLFGDIPIATTTDYRVNNVALRRSAEQVYQQIVADLKDAQDLLSADFLAADVHNTTNERIRPTKWAATALLSRVYLYMGEWENAAAQATLVINETSKFDILSDLNAVFIKNSMEAIWQLQPVTPGYNTSDAFYFVLETTPDGYAHPVSVSNFLLNAFEGNDKRRINWMGNFESYYYPYKYKIGVVGQPLTEYLTVLRLSEQYLIRAEAYAHEDNIANAQNDLNIIRHRAGLAATQAENAETLLSAILKERQVELFAEWGHRWFDLKRTGRINEVMTYITPAKGGVWSTNSQLFPIPLSELKANKNLIQNPGY